MLLILPVLRASESPFYTIICNYVESQLNINMDIIWKPISSCIFDMFCGIVGSAIRLNQLTTIKSAHNVEF